MGRKTKMNKITSPELLAQVNPENMDLLDEFIQYLESTDKSKGTIDQYTSDLYIAFVWNLQHNNNIPFVNWNKRHVMKLQNWLLNENENSPARVRRVKASMSSMSNFIENVMDDEYPNFRNIINKIPSPPNQPVRENTVVKGEEVESLLSELVSRGKIQMACCVALMAYGGRRKSEIPRFKVSDFNDDKLVCNGALWKSDPIKTKGRGKGKFLNCYTLAHKFRPYLNMWLEERKKLGIESVWLFPNPNNYDEQLPTSTINSWMKLVTKILGVPSYAHMFRHRFTTMLAEEGIPDNVIKEIQGWSDIGLVSVYVDLTVDDTLDKYFGADGIKHVEKKSIEDI